jgi:hypothetical protein
MAAIDSLVLQTATNPAAKIIITDTADKRTCHAKAGQGHQGGCHRAAPLHENTVEITLAVYGRILG